jgi:hypothetical protein
MSTHLPCFIIGHPEKFVSSVLAWKISTSAPAASTCDELPMPIDSFKHHCLVHDHLIWQLQHSGLPCLLFHALKLNPSAKNIGEAVP